MDAPGIFCAKVTRRYAEVKVPVLVAEHDVVPDELLLVEDKSNKEEEDDGPPQAIGGTGGRLIAGG